DIVDQYKQQLVVIENEYTGRFQTAAPSALGGTFIDHFYDSGLFGHGFNLASAAIANHAVVLPVGMDPAGIGPASFDASYTPTWTQAGLCTYLRREIFPLGMDVKGSFSVRNKSGDFPAVVGDDSPVECHDGSLTMFTSSPAMSNCAVTLIPEMIAD